MLKLVIASLENNYICTILITVYGHLIIEQFIPFIK